MRNSTRWLTLGSVVMIAGCGGDGGPPPIEPPLTATLSGVVREAATSTPVSGATVSAGSVSTTTAANGQFELRNAPIGPAVSVSVNAAGFDPFSQSLAVQAGANSITISLLRKTFFETDGFLIHVPPEVSTIRGVFFRIMGATADSRPLLRGDLAFYQAFPLAGDVAEYRQRMMQFARTHGFALMGARFEASDLHVGTYTRILQALQTVSNVSGHPELAHAPLLIHGGSLGGCLAYQFSVLNPQRVIGFITAKSPCMILDGTTALSIPAYFFIGEEDRQVPEAAAITTELFEKYRARGATWALAIEPGAGHETVADHDLLFNWLAAVTVRRLPDTTTPGAPVTLRSVAEASGWLADRTAFSVAEYSCYNSDRLKASWLPSEQTARDWQAMVSGRSVTTVIGCAQ